MSSGVVLVTGASGKLGTLTCAALQARDWHVRALAHRSPVEHADESVEGSLEDAASLSHAVRGVDAVVHLAAITHSRRAARYLEVNAAGTRRLVEAAGSAGVTRFVLGSTRAISPAGGAYSRSKAQAEAVVRDSGMPFAIVRLPEVYGAGGREGVDRIIGDARRGTRIVLVAADAAQVCPVHVDDVTAAVARAVEAESGTDRTYTLAGDCVSLRAFAEACVSTFESRSRIVSIPVVLARAAAVVARIVPLPLYPDQVARLLAPKPFPTADALHDLGFAPRPLSVGLSA